MGVLAAYSSSGSGPWCAQLGKAAGSPLSADDIGKIISIVFDYMTKHGYGDPTGTVPAPWNAAIYAQTATAIHNGLTPLIGKITCDQLPADLSNLPSVKANIPSTDPGQVVADAIAQAVAGLGAIFGPLVIHAIALVAILVLLILAIKKVTGV